MSKNILQKCEENIRKLHGLPPHNGEDNYLRGDPALANNIKRNFPHDIVVLAYKKLGLKHD